MNEYKYAELTRPREIRLLRLEPELANGRLSVRVETVSLDDHDLDFVALSYVWGPQDPSFHISCDASGSTLAVGHNLENLLKLLVESQSWTDKLFIDRLCINQENTDERNHQVLLMGEIYSKAKLVLIWLGNEMNDTKLAFDKIASIHQDLVREENLDSKGYTTNHNVKYPSFDSKEAAAIRQLLDMDWFKRVWTFQEVVLAKNAVLKCGTHHMAWSRLANLLQGLEKYRHGPTYASNFLRGADDAAFAMVKSWAYRRIKDVDHFKTGVPNVSLMALLHDLRKRQSADPRDKVYALLNVSVDVSAADLKPNYRLSHLEVYAETAKHLLRKHQSLGFLALVEKKDKPDLVSWVPDFRSRDELNFLHQARLIFRPTQEVWRASGSCKAFVPPPDSPLLHLPVHGICIGKVVAMTEPPGNLMGNIALGEKVLDGGQWHNFARTAAQEGLYGPTGESIDLAFYRTRIWDCRPDEAAHRRFRNKPLTSEDFPSFVPQSSARALENLKHWQNDDLSGRVLNGTTRKRLVKTETGYLGLARRCVELGDELWILMGFDTPCVLKRVSAGCYSFGGEAYVHGAMDGEILLRTAGRHTAAEPINHLGEEDMRWLDALGYKGYKGSVSVQEIVLF